MFSAHYRLPIFVPTVASMCEGCPIQCEGFAFTGVTQGCSFLLITYILHDCDSASLKTIEISLKKEKEENTKEKALAVLVIKMAFMQVRAILATWHNGCALLICISKG